MIHRHKSVKQIHKANQGQNSRRHLIHLCIQLNALPSCL